MFNQTFDAHDLLTIGLLVILEGLLSIDNALVLGLLARRVPKDKQSLALTCGLVGAFAFRFIAILAAQLLLKWRIVKLIGGAYLIYIAAKHLFFEAKEQDSEVIRLDEYGRPILVHEATGVPVATDEAADEIKARVPIPIDIEDTLPGKPVAKLSFWYTVAVIELTDIAFAIDSILAAIALVGPSPNESQYHPKLWVVMLGGMLGIVVMRVAATLFIQLLERFPRFEIAAYLLVIVIGAKLLVDWGFNTHEHPHLIDFHDMFRPAFWIFWSTMAACLGYGFVPHRTRRNERGNLPPV